MSGSSQSSLRKTLGALKDTTTVSLAKINSGYKKDLDIAIVKATNHVERPAKERHIKAVFAAISATKLRADVAYCIHALARRLSKTRNWAVALKTLIVIHRALREVDPTFQEEIINYDSSKGHMLSLTQFKDNSSHNAWDYSAWVRCYALFLEERLECFKVLKYDIETDRLRTKDLDTPELLEQLQALLQLLHRVIGCQPQGAAAHNFIVRLALSMVVSESIKIYNAISDGAVNLVDKFFEMQRYDALKALDIYHRAGQQSGRLSKFYENCKELDIGHGERFMKIKQPPASFLQAMEEYVQEAPRGSTACKDLADDKSKTILAVEYKKNPEVKQEHPLSPPPEPEPKPEPKPKPEPIRVEAPKSEPPQDLLGLNEPAPAATELDEKNALALAIAPVDATEQLSPTGQNPANGTTGWELALITSLSTIKTAPATSKLDGGLDKLTLDRLYDDALQRNNPNPSYNPWEQPMHNPFYASNVPSPVQMTGMYNQQQMTMMGPQQPVNPFENTYGAVGHPYPYGPGTPVQAYNPYSGLI